jgi:hypothetical protein
MSEPQEISPRFGRKATASNGTTLSVEGDRQCGMNVDLI